MKVYSKKYIIFALVFFVFLFCACDVSDALDEMQTGSALKQSNSFLESTDDSSITEPEIISPSDPPASSMNKEYDGIFVKTSIEDYILQVEKHQSGKLVKYPVEIASLCTQ